MLKGVFGLVFAGLDVCIIQDKITSVVVGSLPVKFSFLILGTCIRMWVCSIVFDLL